MHGFIPGTTLLSRIKIHGFLQREGPNYRVIDITTPNVIPLFLFFTTDGMFALTSDISQYDCLGHDPFAPPNIGQLLSPQTTETKLTKLDQAMLNYAIRTYLNDGTDLFDSFLYARGMYYPGKVITADQIIKEVLSILQRETKSNKKMRQLLLEQGWLTK